MTLEILTYRVAMDQDDSDCLANARRVAEDNEEFVPKAAHDARIAQLERELAEARELLQEAWDYYGVLWRGNRIYNHVKTDAASKPAAPTVDEKGEAK
jgi:hypothetical protein